MKKTFSLLIVISIILVLICCEKVKTEPIPITITTNKSVYYLGESVKIEITNNSDSTAGYFVCSYYKGIPPIIYTQKNNSWTGYWAPICNGYSSYCCAELRSGMTYRDTLNLDFEKGTYYIQYMFIVKSSHDYKSFLTSTIKFE